MGNLACITHGSAMIYPSAVFNPLETLKAIQQERCTAAYGVPTMFIAVLEHEQFDEFDLSSLRTGIMAGSPCPQEIMQRVIERMHMSEITICYGMTETAPVSAQAQRQTVSSNVSVRLAGYIRIWKLKLSMKMARWFHAANWVSCVYVVIQ